MGDNTFLSLKQHWLKSMPFRIALLYFLIASLYIFFSDRLLVIITPSMESYQKAQTYKGWGFVATTTFLLYLVLNSEHRQLLRINERLEEEGEKLKTTIGQLEEAFREVRALALRCSKIEEIERRRLADELHDRVGQTLTAMNLNLKILHGLLPRESPQPVFERLQDVQSLIAEAALQIRDVIAELRPPVLDDFGLSEALRWLGERYQKRFNLPLIIHCDDLPERLPDNVETAFYRVAQSALDNAMRHARASEIHLSFQLKPQEVELIVGDNGVGFDPEIVLKSKDYPTWGVKIMRERMLAIGGSLSIKSEKGDGTQVIAVWSLENRA